IALDEGRGWVRGHHHLPDRQRKTEGQNENSRSDNAGESRPPMALYRVMVVAGRASFLAVRDRRRFSGTFRMRMMTRRVWICRAEMGAVQRQQAVDHEPGQRQYRQQPDPLCYRSREWMQLRCRGDSAL